MAEGNRIIQYDCSRFFNWSRPEHIVLKGTNVILYFRGPYGNTMRGRGCMVLNLFLGPRPGCIYGFSFSSERVRGRREVLTEHNHPLTLKQTWIEKGSSSGSSNQILLIQHKHYHMEERKQSRSNTIHTRARTHTHVYIYILYKYISWLFLKKLYFLVNLNVCIIYISLVKINHIYI